MHVQNYQTPFSCYCAKAILLRSTTWLSITFQYIFLYGLLSSYIRYNIQIHPTIYNTIYIML